MPNALTILRLVAVPVFVALLWPEEDGRSTAAGIIFLAASVTDWLDGRLARRLAVQSRFGRLADPLADRLLIGSAAIILWYHDQIPAVAAILLLGRDILLLAGLPAASSRGYELSVVYLGKTATFVLMAALACVMLAPASARWPLAVLWIGIALAFLAAGVYVVTIGRMVVRRRST